MVHPQDPSYECMKSVFQNSTKNFWVYFMDLRSIKNTQNFSFTLISLQTKIKSCGGLLVISGSTSFGQKIFFCHSSTEMAPVRFWTFQSDATVPQQNTSQCFTTAYPHPPSSITAYQHLPSSTTAYHHLPSSNIAYHQLSSPTTSFHNLQSSTAADGPNLPKSL